MKKSKFSFSVLDQVAFVSIFLLLGVFPPDLVMMFVYLALFPYLFLTGRRDALWYFAIATAFALIWILLANGYYGYSINMLKIHGWNAFPFFAWATGLFGSYILYAHWEKVFKVKSTGKRWLLFLVFYWSILILVETVAYHFFGIRNALNGHYAGLPICNCIHAPRWMQAAYFLMGPLYFGVCELVLKRD